MLVFTNVLYMDLVLYVMCVCLFIPVWVFVVLGWQLFASSTVVSRNNESDVAEFFWTVIPSSCVIVLCYYNLNCISCDLLSAAGGLTKVVGRQWYWSYETDDGEEYDSMMTDFVSGVDKPLRMIRGVYHHLLVTSSDVIHSFSIPEFNLKTDAIPGRLNHVAYCPGRVGVFVGYCTELCGAGHAYMPIVVEVTV